MKFREEPQYRYDYLIDNGNTYPTRFNRFSGTSELFVPQRGWIHLGGPSPTPKKESVLSADELGKLDGTLKITNYGWINADIYNGTEKDIESVTVKVTVYEKEDNELFDRTFRLTSSAGRALSSAEYIADCGFTLNDGQSIKWYIVSANFK